MLGAAWMCQPAGADDWEEVSDDETKQSYYYNRQTRESRWDVPLVGRSAGVKPNR